MLQQVPDEIRYAVCITDAEPDLEFRKIYPVFPDAKAAAEEYLRVVDESGEDYLYPADFFVFLEMPEAAQKALFTSRSAA